MPGCPSLGCVLTSFAATAQSIHLHCQTVDHRPVAPSRCHRSANSTLRFPRVGQCFRLAESGYTEQVAPMTPETERWLEPMLEAMLIDHARTASLARLIEM